jgi:hypothetical protein
MHSARSHQAGVDCEKFALVKSSADRSSMNGSKPKLTRVRDDTPCWQIQNFSPARNLRLSGGAGEVTCKFEVKVENTKPGDSVVLLGGTSALGDWNEGRALVLNTDQASFPWWRADVELPAGDTVEYKFAIRSSGVHGALLWEPLPPGMNRRSTIPDATSLTVFSFVYGDTSPPEHSGSNVAETEKQNPPLEKQDTADRVEPSPGTTLTQALRVMVGRRKPTLKRASRCMICKSLHPTPAMLPHSFLQPILSRPAEQTTRGLAGRRHETPPFVSCTVC